MSELADRILYIRKEKELSQSAFAEKLNLSQNFVWMMESGKRSPSDRTIFDICRKFDVSEEWLRTGKGAAFVPKSIYQEMGEIVQAASRVDPEKARKFFDYLLDGMTEADVLLMYQIFCRTFPDLIKNGTKKGQPEDQCH